MKAIDMIKKISAGRSTLYTRVLIFEFLEDINWHKEAATVAEYIPTYDFMSALDLLRRESSYSKQNWDYFEKDYQISEYRKAFKDLMEKEGNFRVAQNPHNKNQFVGYDAFQSFQAAQSHYSVIAQLCGWGLEEGETEELLELAKYPQHD